MQGGVSNVDQVVCQSFNAQLEINWIKYFRSLFVVNFDLKSNALFGDISESFRFEGKWKYNNVCMNLTNVFQLDFVADSLK